MPKQPTFPGLRGAMKKKDTRREHFLAEMNTVLPWSRMLALIAPHHPKVGPKGGRPPMPLEAMRRSTGAELGDNRIPDETTFLIFRHLLEPRGLTKAIFTDVTAHLADKSIALRSGTLVDVDSRVTHSLDTSTAKDHNRQVWDEHLRDDETSAWVDKGYVRAERKAALMGPGKVWGGMCKAPKDGAQHPLDAPINWIVAMVRAKVEHSFRVIKGQFGLAKTRYRGLTKNHAQLFTLFPHDNLFLVRRRLIA